MTDSEVLAGLFIALELWLVLLCAGGALLGGPGVLLGHVAGVGCAMFGVPQRWLFDNSEGRS